MQLVEKPTTLILQTRLAPFITLLLIIILSLLLASLILPTAQQTYLAWAKHTIPFLELAVLAFIISKLRVVARNLRAAKASEIYATDALAASLKQTLGNMPGLGFILTEFTLLYFAIGGWFKHFTPRDARHRAFSYHRKSGYGAILGVMFMVIITETVALHLLLQQWSALAAWIFTALSLYSMLWLFGDYHALRLHPFVLDEKYLYLRLGLRWRADIPLENIVAVHPFNEREKRDCDYLRLTVFGDARLVLSCKQPVIVRGLFGLKREVRRLGFFVDEEKLFREELQRRVAAVRKD